jgi:hypothetical protein
MKLDTPTLLLMGELLLRAYVLLAIALAIGLLAAWLRLR